MRLALASVVSVLAALVTAHTPPDYSQPPEGNAILKPELDEIVPVGEPYTIKWTPTTEGPISLVLLRGPSTNVKPIATIAETIKNDGSYIWTPSPELEPDVTHYGLMLVVEGTGQYQYSTQFGIKNPGYEGGGSNSSTPTASSTATGTSSTGTASPSTSGVSSMTQNTTKPTTGFSATESSMSATTTPVSTATSSDGGSGGGSTPTSSAVEQPTTMETSTPTASSSSGPSPSNPGSASGSPEPSTTMPSSSPSSPAYTGAANRNALGMGAVAAGAFAVLAF